MINSHRGEIAATLDGRTYKLCLTLGALAELESVFGHEDMLALAERFSTGRLAARDIARIIGAGLRAGGNDIGDDTVLAMQAENGVAGFIDIVTRLLAATFGQTQSGVTAATLMARAEVDPALLPSHTANGPAPAPFHGPR